MVENGEVIVRAKDYDAGRLNCKPYSMRVTDIERKTAVFPSKTKKRLKLFWSAYLPAMWSGNRSFPRTERLLAAIFTFNRLTSAQRPSLDLTLSPQPRPNPPVPPAKPGISFRSHRQILVASSRLLLGWWMGRNARGQKGTCDTWLKVVRDRMSCT